mgnify:CR=1 FL=1
MYTQEQIYDAIDLYIDRSEITPDTDLFVEQGICGDDFDEMMGAYQQAFNVDMNSYLWYFHSDEEGSFNSIGGAFFKPPYERVKRIPLTPKLLLEFANQGSWGIQYPDHKLPKRRWDIIIHQILLVLVLSWALYSCLT